MQTITIKTDDLRGAQTTALVEAHWRGMVSTTRHAESVHTLNLMIGQSSARP